MEQVGLLFDISSQIERLERVIKQDKHFMNEEQVTTFATALFSLKNEFSDAKRSYIERPREPDTVETLRGVLKRVNTILRDIRETTDPIKQEKEAEMEAIRKREREMTVQINQKKEAEMEAIIKRERPGEILALIVVAFLVWLIFPDEW